MSETTEQLRGRRGRKAAGLIQIVSNRRRPREAGGRLFGRGSRDSRDSWDSRDSLLAKIAIIANLANGQALPDSLSGSRLSQAGYLPRLAIKPAARSRGLAIRLAALAGPAIQLSLFENNAANLAVSGIGVDLSLSVCLLIRFAI